MSEKRKNYKGIPTYMVNLPSGMYFAHEISKILGKALSTIRCLTDQLGLERIPVIAENKRGSYCNRTKYVWPGFEAYAREREASKIAKKSLE